MTDLIKLTDLWESPNFCVAVIRSVLFCKVDNFMEVCLPFPIPDRRKSVLVLLMIYIKMCRMTV